MNYLDRPNRETRFVEISASREVRNAMKVALDIPDYPVVVNSRPGMGKTTALLHHGERLHAKYCCIDQSAKSVGGMMKALLATLDWTTDAKYTWDISQVLKPRLSASEAGRPLLVVDEFQNLNLDALRELLSLHEACSTALVLSGNDHRLARSRTVRRQVIWN